MESLLNRTYEVASANHPFLLEESITCARMLLDKTSWETIQQAVVQEHLFSTTSATTAQSYLRAVRFRLEGATPELLALIAHEDDKTARYTLFYILMHKNRLLRELLEEPIRDCALEGLSQISRSDILDFFEFKRENSEALSEWSDSTWRKFWGNTLKSVLETGLLQGAEPLEIITAPVPAALRRWLLHSKENLALSLLLDPDA